MILLTFVVWKWETGVGTCLKHEIQERSRGMEERNAVSQSDTYMGIFLS